MGESEQIRADEQHAIFTLAKGALNPGSTAKIQKAHRVLDLGCGTGIWCNEFASSHPHAKVQGVDIKPPLLQDRATFPPNCTFVEGNVEADWTAFLPKDAAFDYVHARLLVAGVRDWDGVFRRVAASLAPGGIFESYEGTFVLAATHTTVPIVDSPAMRWFDKFATSMHALGLDPRGPEYFSAQLEKAGSRVVERRVVETSLNPARNVAEDSEGRERIAMFQLKNWTRLVDQMTEKMAAFIPGAEEAASFRSLATEAKEDMKCNGRSRGYYVTFLVHVAEKGDD